MTQRHDEDRLREEFQELRSRTRASGRVPDFRGMLENAKAQAAAQPELGVLQGGQTEFEARRRRVTLIGGWATAAIAAAVAGILLLNAPSDGDREFERLVAAYSADVAAGAWRSPTSALLDVPGMDLTRSVPSFGSTLRGLGPGRLPDGPDAEGRSR